MVREPVNIHTLQSVFYIMDTQCCVKVCSACRGECVNTGGLCRPAHLCVAHLNCTHIFFYIFSCDLVRCGGRWSMFQEVGVCLGFQRGAE